MANDVEVANAANDAKLALLKRIEKGAEPGGLQARILSELALAYRYLAGGSQPGSSTVEK